MAEEKKRLSAVERAEKALAAAKAKAEEKDKLKRKAALVELARRRQAFINADTKVAAATEAALAIGVSEEDIAGLDHEAVLAEAEAKPKQPRKPAAKKDETKES